MTAPYYLHWGAISQELTVSGIDPASGVIARKRGEGGKVADVKSGVLSPTLTSSGIRRLSGRGGSSGIKGSGGTCG